MASLIIGDFRAKQLQYHQNKNELDEFDFNFLIEDSAEYSWFSTSALAQLPLMSLDITSIIIMLGFNDCTYSCAWNSFNIDQIATDYYNAINELLDLYAGIDFYFCSINPVELGYPFAEYSDEIIPVNILDTKIKQFNNKIKELCVDKISFIDSYDYLTKTSFKTYDGVRFNYNTSLEVLSYISSQLQSKTIKLGGASLSIVRDTNDKAPKPGEESFLYWTHTEKGGLSPCTEVRDGCVLPNCTGYAWGRFYEMTGSPLNGNFASLNAENWWEHADSLYERGQEPRIGAIACWRHPTENVGHLAIVETYDESTGVIVTSESGWRTEKPTYKPVEAFGEQENWHFWVTSRKYDDSNKCIWREYRDGQTVSSWIEDKDSGYGYEFQGFIYNPKISSSGTIGDYVPLDAVQADPNRVFGFIGGTEPGEEMRINARYIWQYFGNKPEEERWTLNAVAGLLGNIQSESSINPVLFEMYAKRDPDTGFVIDSLDLPDSVNQIKFLEYVEAYKGKTGRFPGFGLTQWTNTDIDNWFDHKLVKWCNDNELNYWQIDSQLKRIDYEVANEIQFGKSSYSSMTFKEFIKSTLPADTLACVFLHNYERPQGAESARIKRGNQAKFWYDYLQNYPLSGVPVEVYTKPALSISSLKIDILQPTSVNCSFLTRSGTSYSYKFIKVSNNKEIDTGNGSISTEDDLGKYIHFSSAKLTPNTEYKISVEVLGDSEADKVDISHTFITPQAYPEAITKVELTATGTRFPNETFQLITNTVSNWGYWAKNSKKYILDLIINGKVKNSKELTSLTSTFDFNLFEVFGDCEINVNDIIQICVYTQTIDDGGNPIYNKKLVKASNPICFLKQSIITQLNVD